MKKLGKYELSNVVTEATTHVVSGAARRTLNTLAATVRGCWMLSIEWVRREGEGREGRGGEGRGGEGRGGERKARGREGRGGEREREREGKLFVEWGKGANLDDVEMRLAEPQSVPTFTNVLTLCSRCGRVWRRDSGWRRTLTR